MVACVRLAYRAPENPCFAEDAVWVDVRAGRVYFAHDDTWGDASDIAPEDGRFAALVAIGVGQSLEQTLSQVNRQLGVVADRYRA